MGKMTLEEVREAVQELTPSDRDELMSYLIDSIASHANSSVEKANLDEIKRRMDMAVKDPSLWLDGEMVMAEIEAEFNAKV
jgi:putative addiction module component (TIGR02574 family)